MVKMLIHQNEIVILSVHVPNNRPAKIHKALKLIKPKLETGKFKLSLFANDLIIYVGNAKELTKSF